MKRVAVTLCLGLSLLGCVRTEPDPVGVGLAHGPADAGKSATAAATAQCDGRVHVALEYPGASAAELEELAVLRVEHVLSRLAGVSRVSSRIVEGHVDLWADAPSVSIQRTRTQVVAAIEAMDKLHDTMEFPLVSVVRRGGPKYLVIVRGPRGALASAAETLHDAISDAPGTRGVQWYGDSRLVLSITPDDRALHALGLSALKLVAAVGAEAQASSGPLGGPRGDPGDLADKLGKISIGETTAGAPVHLREVASVAVRRDAEGESVWISRNAASVLWVETDDPASLRQIVSETAAPPGTAHALAGRLEVRGCASPFARHRIAGDFDVLELEVGPGGTAPEEIERLIRSAPTIPDAVWLWGEPSLDGRGTTRTAHAGSRLQLLIGEDSTHKATLLRWLAQTPGVAGVRHDGPDWAEVVIELRHPEQAQLRSAADRLLDRLRERGLWASTAPSGAAKYEVRFNRGAATRLGVGLEEIAGRVEQAVRGTTVAALRYGRRSVLIRIESAAPRGEGTEELLARLTTLPLRAADGASVPLSAVATILGTNEPGPRLRRDGERVLDVHVSTHVQDLDATQATIDAELGAAQFRDHRGLSARRLH